MHGEFYGPQKRIYILSNPIYMAGAPAAHISQRELLATFDPLYTRRKKDALPNLDRIVELYDRGTPGEQGRPGKKQRTLTWKFTTGAAKLLVPQMTSKLKQSVRTKHKINHHFAYELKNVETNELVIYYKNRNSPWFSKLSEAKDWLQTQEELRPQGENIGRPDTKWSFLRSLFVTLKTVLDRQPLQIGFGLLPDWLRNKKSVIALDTYKDNLCPFRCLAVHQGVRKDRNTQKARALAQSFFAAHNIPGNTITLKHFHLLERHFKQGISAYTVLDNGDFVLSYTPSRYNQVGLPIITVSIHGTNAFLITDINKVTNNYTCGECLARFTQAGALSRHAKICTRGRTVVACPGNQI